MNLKEEFKQKFDGKINRLHQEEIADWWLAKFDTHLTEIAEEVGKEKFTFKEVDWGEGLSSYAEGLNKGLDKAIEIINNARNENI